MNIDNGKISSTQLKKTLIISTISTSIMVVPGLASYDSGKGGFVAILGGSLLALLYGLLLWILSKNIEGHIATYTTQAIGRCFTTFFGILYLIKFTFTCVFLVTIYTNIITQTLLPHTDKKVIILLLLCVTLYISSRKLETALRLYEFLYFLILVPIIFFFLLGIPKIQLTNLMPGLMTMGNHSFRMILSVFFTFFPLEFVVFLTPSMDAKEKELARKNIIYSVGIICGILLLVYAVVVGILGSVEARNHIWSTVTVLQLLSVPGGFIQRLDGIVLAFWLLSIFSVLSFLFYFTKETVTMMFHEKGKKGYLLFFSFFVFILTLVPVPVNHLQNLFTKYLLFIGIPGSILLPFIIILANKLKRRRKDEKI